jgi:hypothetical protein
MKNEFLTVSYARLLSNRIDDFDVVHNPLLVSEVMVSKAYLSNVNRGILKLTFTMVTSTIFTSCLVVR